MLCRPTNNQAGREGTPLDDDGFESLNGNGSSENGDEAADDEVETTHAPTSPDIKGNSSNFKEVCHKCPDECKVETDLKQETIDVGNTNNNMCCESVICDDNVPNVELFEPYKDKQSKFRIIDTNVGKGNSVAKSPCTSDINVSNNNSKTSLDWVSGSVKEHPRRGSDAGCSCEEVDHIINQAHIIQRRQSAPPRPHRINHDTDSDSLTGHKKV